MRRSKQLSASSSDGRAPVERGLGQPSDGKHASSQRQTYRRPEVRNLPSRTDHECGPANPAFRKFGQWFQVRWAEALGDPECPYLYRWTLIVFGFSIRLHHWIKSDDRRFFHDHACDFVSIVLRGHYVNVTPHGRFHVTAGSMWRSRADTLHYLDIPKCGAWTLLLCGRPYRKWGFWVDGKKMRPWKYFKKYGVIQGPDYQ